jgi:hypothetical protein
MMEKKYEVRDGKHNILIFESGMPYWTAAFAIGAYPSYEAALKAAQLECDRLNAEAEKAKIAVDNAIGLTDDQAMIRQIGEELKSIKAQLDNLATKFGDYRVQRGEAHCKLHERVVKLERWQRSHDSLPKEEFKTPAQSCFHNMDKEMLELAGEDKPSRAKWVTNRPGEPIGFINAPNMDGVYTKQQLCDILNAGEDALELANEAKKWIGKRCRADFTSATLDREATRLYAKLDEYTAAIRRKMRGE